MKKISAITIVFVLMLLCYSTSAVLAQNGTALKIKDVPKCLADRTKMENERQKLIALYEVFEKAAGEFNARCASQTSDSPIYGECMEEKDLLISKQRELIPAINEFNANLDKKTKDEFEAALNKSATTSEEALCAPITNSPDKRSLVEYAKVINQFEIHAVGSNPKLTIPKRYIAKVGIDPQTQEKVVEETYCNIFVSDVTRAMMAGIPHVLGQGSKRTELDVNMMVDWLKSDGKNKLGWHRVSVDYAQKMANLGHPTIAIFKNPYINPLTKKRKSGHVSMIRPGSEKIPPNGPAIAQAGLVSTNAEHLYDVVKDPKKLKSLEYWYHD